MILFVTGAFKCIHMLFILVSLQRKELGKGSVSFCENRNGLLIPMVSFVLIRPSSKDGCI